MAPDQKQPAFISLFNYIARGLERAGLSVPTLDAKRLIHRAQWRTGLRDFGDENYREGLERLTSELQDHAKLSQVGRLGAHFNLMENLCVRLNLVEYRLKDFRVVAFHSWCVDVSDRDRYPQGVGKTDRTIRDFV